jgi:hypothetical protein
MMQFALPALTTNKLAIISFTMNQNTCWMRDCGTPQQVLPSWAMTKAYDKAIRNSGFSMHAPFSSARGSCFGLRLPQVIEVRALAVPAYCMCIPAMEALTTNTGKWKKDRQQLPTAEYVADNLAHVHPRAMSRLAPICLPVQQHTCLSLVLPDGTARVWQAVSTNLVISSLEISMLTYGRA